MLKKNTGLLVIAALVLAAGLIVVYYVNTRPGNVARSSTTGGDASNADFAGYISSFTSGQIASSSTIRIRLSRDFAGTTALNSPVEEELFSFSPAIDGHAEWKDAQTIEFIPAERLAGGQLYEATFHLGRVTDVESALEKFRFRFQTPEQSLQLVAGDLKSYNASDFKYYSLGGSISTADFAESHEVEAALKVMAGKSQLPVKWTHETGGTSHAFVVDSIPRAAAQATLTLQCDGKAIGVTQTDTRQYVVPARDHFMLLNTKVISGGDPYVLLNFSNPVNEQRSLEGLLTVATIPALKFIVSGNQVMLYPGEVKTGTHILKVSGHVRDAKEQRLGTDAEFSIAFTAADPAVRFPGEGTILPSTTSLTLPFETVNLKAVDVTVVKIYASNVLQFLQDNSMNEGYRLAHVGKRILKKRVILGINNPADYNSWKRSLLDLSTLFKAERGAIYRVSLSFKKSYSTFPCLGNTFEDLGMEEVQTEDEEISYFNQYGYYSDDDYEYEEDYEWSERNDPCKPSYYRYPQRTQTRNILATDIGITAKRGNDGSLFITATDLLSAGPMAGVNIELYDFQKQLLYKGSTGGDGHLTVDEPLAASFLVARKDGQFNYIRFSDAEALPLTLYDVGGVAVKKGVKGFLYGERGVWRPGDTMFLNFILEDKARALPENHPVTLSLFNPRGQLDRKITTSQGVNGFYNFTLATDKNAPTGVWNAEVKVGPVKFTKMLRVETVMPNRLKIRLAFPDEELLQAAGQNTVHLETSWLTGALAKNLKVKMNVNLTSQNTVFSKYPNHVFTDATASFESQTLEVFSGQVDETGEATIPLNLHLEGRAGGMLRAAFNTQVFEPGGAFSVDRVSMDYAPYRFFCGILLPGTDQTGGILYTEREHKLDIVTVDAKGKPVSRPRMRFEMYKLEWRWWWDQYHGELANYATDSYHRPVKTQVFSTVGGKGTVSVNIPDNAWGRYLIRVVDEDGGHSSAVVTWFDWANWRERDGDNGSSRILANMLTFSTDREKYKAGEEATVTIPTPRNGRALITVENGSRVLEAHWVETKDAATNFKLKVKPEMAPNVYVHVTLMQPHSRTNDLPIRLYGVTRLLVDDPETHLAPQIAMPDLLQPEKPVEITVSEKNGKDMAFTLAMVDEGLLDITRFKTPDPHAAFYATEALGVRTWDMFDQVIGAYGAELERVLSIGGDGTEISNDAAKANRFKPMVRFFGPYFVEGGDRQKITFTMPMYLGSVRTMVIAGDRKAYGFAEKTTPVKAPLMIFATLPRVISVTEEVKLPVSLLGGDRQVGETTVRIEATGPLAPAGDATQKTTVGKDDEKLVYFTMKAGNTPGIAKVKVTASGGGQSVTQEIEIDVRNPNPYETVTTNYVVNAGGTLTKNYTPHGVAGSNSGVIEIASVPPVNLGNRLKWLVGYPHGCIEQTTSKAFAQLYLPDLMELTPDIKQQTEDNVREGLNRLRHFQLGSGGFAYWPGGTTPTDWGTSYAGQFFLAAEKKGYSLPPGLRQRWIAYQQRASQEYDPGRKTPSGDKLQAYRLYVLSLAGAPQLGAMNRLREQPSLSNQARWLLAAAYAQAGQHDEASRLVAAAPARFTAYHDDPYTYGSPERDLSIVLQALCLMNRREQAFAQLKLVSGFLSSASWYSTQTTAFALVGVSQFMERFSRASAMQGKCTVNGKAADLSKGRNIVQVPLEFRSGKGGEFAVQNTGSGDLYVSVIARGKPAPGDEEAGNENITVDVGYQDLAGNIVEPGSMEQGANFMMSVSVRNLGARGRIENLALSVYVPSGWEIHNARLDEGGGALKSSAFDYQDIRDDRVYTYFSLNTSESKTFNILLNATYEGQYYLPAISVEAMYDNTVYARTKGRRVEVKKTAGVAGN